MFYSEYFPGQLIVQAAWNRTKAGSTNRDLHYYRRGVFAWQQNSLETFNTDKAFILELKDYADTLGSDNIVFCKDLKTKILFYMEVPKPLSVLRNISELGSLLNSKDNTWILVSRSEDSQEIAAVLSQEILSNPILQEKVYPWEKNKNIYQAWLINRAKDYKG